MAFITSGRFNTRVAMWSFFSKKTGLIGMTLNSCFGLRTIRLSVEEAKINE
jgi:hypothetical protein